MDQQQEKVDQRRVSDLGVASQDDACEVGRVALIEEFRVTELKSLIVYKDWNRTSNLRCSRPMLYHASFIACGLFLVVTLMPDPGFEPGEDLETTQCGRGPAVFQIVPSARPGC